MSNDANGMTGRGRAWVAAGVLGVAAAVAALSLDYRPLAIREGDFALFGKVVGLLVVLSAIMERVLDVLLTFRHGELAERTRDAMHVAQQELERAQAESKAAPGDESKKGELEAARTALSDAQEKRRLQRLATRESALPAALVLGFFISALGFRVLDSLVQIPPPGEDVSFWGQAHVIHIVDIIVTGAVLAGGSDGLHKLVEVYRNVTEKK